MSNLGGMLPRPLVDLAFRARGLADTAVKRENARLIRALALSDDAHTRRWQKNLASLNGYGRKYAEFIREFCACSLDTHEHGTLLTDTLNPIVVCVVKNDLMRMQLFFEHYRALGVKQFAVLDDHSQDGTAEFLLAQPDAVVFTTEKPYTTVRRQVWINRMISQLGLNRWYLVADSDELFDYMDSASRSVKMLAESLQAHGQSRVKALLLDMFSPHALYTDRVGTKDDITAEYTLFSKDYTLEKKPHDERARGGAREIILAGAGSSSIVSKYPLIFVTARDILINSHYNFPFTANYPSRPTAVLRHYKFLPGDRAKYEERVAKGNFYNNSTCYKAYLAAEGSLDYQRFAENLCEYQDFTSAYQSIAILREE